MFARLIAQSETAALPLYEVPDKVPLTVCAFKLEPRAIPLIAFETRAAVAIEPALNVAVEVEVNAPTVSWPMVLEEMSPCGKARSEVVDWTSAPHEVFETNGSAPPPEAVEAMTMVLALVVVDKVMFVPAFMELKRKSTEDFVSKILSPVPKLEAVLVSPTPPPHALPEALIQPPDPTDRQPVVDVANPGTNSP